MTSGDDASVDDASERLGGGERVNLSRVVEKPDLNFISKKEGCFGEGEAYLHVFEG